MVIGVTANLSVVVRYDGEKGRKNRGYRKDGGDELDRGYRKEGMLGWAGDTGRRGGGCSRSIEHG